MKRIVKIKNNQKMEVLQFSVKDLQEVIVKCLTLLKNHYPSFSKFLLFLFFSVIVIYYSIVEGNNGTGGSLFTFLFYESFLFLAYLIYCDFSCWYNSYWIYEDINYAVNEHIKQLANNYEYVEDNGDVIKKVEIPLLYVTVNVSLFAFIYYKYIKKESFDTIEILK